MTPWLLALAMIKKVVLGEGCVSLRLSGDTIATMEPHITQTVAHFSGMFSFHLKKL